MEKINDINVVKAEVINTLREFSWRLVKGEEKSEWSKHYQGLLTHTFKNGRTFAYATAHYQLGNHLKL